MVDQFAVNGEPRGHPHFMIGSAEGLVFASCLGVEGAWLSELGSPPSWHEEQSMRTPMHPKRHHGGQAISLTERIRLAGSPGGNSNANELLGQYI
jgi:hypothetical protein